MAKTEPLPQRNLELKEAPYRGGDTRPKYMLPNIVLDVREEWGFLKVDQPVYVHPADATIEALQGVLYQVPLKFEWETTGLCEVTYPPQMRLLAAYEWRRRFPNRHNGCRKIEQAIDNGDETFAPYRKTHDEHPGKGSH